MAGENLIKHRQSAAVHLGTMQRFAPMWKRFRSPLFCPFCLVRGPKHLLDCGHSLCRACVVICGEVSTTDEWRATIRRCPLCEELNWTTFLLRPPTAGRRILALRCRETHKVATVRFLKELQSHIGLTGWRLRDHFDIFVGSGVGQKAPVLPRKVCLMSDISSQALFLPSRSPWTDGQWHAIAIF